MAQSEARSSRRRVGQSLIYEESAFRRFRHLHAPGTGGGRVPVAPNLSLNMPEFNGSSPFGDDTRTMVRVLSFFDRVVSGQHHIVVRSGTAENSSERRWERSTKFRTCSTARRSTSYTCSSRTFRSSMVKRTAPHTVMTLLYGVTRKTRAEVLVCPFDKVSRRATQIQTPVRAISTLHGDRKIRPSPPVSSTRNRCSSRSPSSSAGWPAHGPAIRRSSTSRSTHRKRRRVLLRYSNELLVTGIYLNTHLNNYISCSR